MLVRLARVIWLAGTALGVLCCLGAAMAFLMPRGDVGGGFLFLAVGVPALLGSWAISYILAGD